MYPIGELIQQALRIKGLSKSEVVIKVGYRDINKGLKMLDDVISGKALGYRHTPMANLPRVLGVSQEEFDAALAKWYELKKIAEEDDAAAMGIYNRRTFKPHLWLRTSRQTPEPIFVAAVCGEGFFKYVALPDGAISADGKVDYETVSQVIRNHYRQNEGSARIFGDIVSYILRLFYEKPGIEFSPDGQIIDTDPPPFSQGEAKLTIGNKEIPRDIIDELAESLMKEMAESVESIEISFSFDKEFDA